ncbi:hypothetical protein [Fimbriiglobus ruber]|uniref:Uncharacterized protein n=1 Tax=Fimbriiglobus ruber TaxID=1908690 RepID=A0A225DU24_9BACT|nr:hypothetical protein [Fimbriiglobus ruber]OWK43104.1 hypothetical protein FRUB_02703 [Fimbriiglobus ruber]
MNVLRGRIKSGQVVLDHPAELPDDTEVIVTPDSTLSEKDGPMTPDEIVRVLAAMDRAQPFDRTDTERATWEAERLAAKAYEKAQFAEHAERLRGMWDDPVPPR